MQDKFTKVHSMSSSAEALASYMRQDYCLVILDVQITDMDGMILLRTMRNAKHTPILALTKPLSAEEIVMILHAGADAVLEKPLNKNVCVAQANKLIQRYVEDDINQGLHRPIIHGSELIISPRYRQVMINGKYISLTRREFDLLHFFADHQEQVFTCEQLYDEIWGCDSAVAIENIVRSQIKRLRKKLSDFGKNYIRTEWGVGYKFVLQDD